MKKLILITMLLTACGSSGPEDQSNPINTNNQFAGDPNGFYHRYSFNPECREITPENVVVDIKADKITVTGDKELTGAFNQQDMSFTVAADGMTCTGYFVGTFLSMDLQTVCKVTIDNTIITCPLKYTSHR